VTEYEALNTQYNDSIDAQEKVILKRKITKLEDDLKAYELHLDREEKPDILDKLHYIDFKRIVERFQQLLDSLGRQGGTTILVLQDSETMAGDLLIKRLQEDLRSQSSSFRYLPVGFAGGNELDERGFLSRLSNHLGSLETVSQSKHLDEVIDAVIEKLCASIQTRSVVFVEVKQWHNLPSQEKVFFWLCSDFYPKLASKLTEVISEKLWRRVYVFLVIVSDDFFPDKCMEGVNYLNGAGEDLCREGNDSIFQVCLENWNQEDIEGWLEFSGLPDNQLESTASRLYSRSRQGIPLIVRNSIEKEFSDE
jgi:hypothetical protein